MCARYLVLPLHESEEMFDIINAANKKYGKTDGKTGEVSPSDKAYILTSGSSGNAMSVNIFDWGFSNFNNNGLIINARSETITEKATFKESFAERRCVIPSCGFFEWTHNPEVKKVKYLFNQQDTKMLYMAGIWRMYNNEPKFVILTTDANESVSDVHERMPVILKRSYLKDWLMSASSAFDLLSEKSPDLIRQKVI